MTKPHGPVTAMALIGMLAMGAPAPAQPAAEPLPRWMAGCWSGAVRGTVVTERWVVADPATMIGTSHTVKGQSVSEFEFLRVVVKGGVATYIAQPGGAPPTSFAATAHTTRAITFENPAHDFPKRIGYERVDATHLTAWIDGGAAPAGQRMEFPLTRVACEP